MKTEIRIDVEDIDHLGIIAGIIDDIGIVEIIDKEIGTHPQEKISAGQVVKAMIINCMGFLTAPLYLFSEFLLVSLFIRAQDLGFLKPLCSKARFFVPDPARKIHDTK